MLLSDDRIFDLEELYLYPDEDVKELDYKLWEVSADGTQYFPDVRKSIKTKIEPGVYTVEYNQNSGYFARKKTIITDDLVPLQEGIVEEMLAEIKSFWKKAELFKEKGFIHKRGIILVGGPGQGKTATINQLAVAMDKIDGICFKIESPQALSMYIEFMKSYFRIIEPDRPVLVVLEDIDYILEAKESELLDMLDGANCINHQITIATSNRLDHLNDLLLRPSRFDWIIELGAPTKTGRKKYLQKMGIEGEELEKFLSSSDKLSMAELKELYVSVKLLDNDFDAVLKRLKDNGNKVINTTFKPKANKVGFGK